MRRASLSSRAFIARTGLRPLRIGTRPMRTSLFLGAYSSSERANRSTSQKLQAMNFGNFMLMPKEMRHFGMAKGDLILQVHGIGPFKVNWVNPSEVQPPDAPAAAAPKPL